MPPPEFNNKINISIGAIAMLIVAAFSLGGIWVGLVGISSKIDAEVGGLRNDMDREISLLRGEVIKEDKYIRGEITDVREDGVTRQGWINSRTDRKVKNHELIYHRNGN